MSVLLLLTGLTEAGAQERPSLRQLADEPAWLALLHFEQGRPTFISDDFYLTEQRSALAELQALVEQADTPVRSEETHPRCRFPARYAWLAEKLDRPSWRTPPSKCRKLHIWLTRHRLTGASIMLVSGYMGNPASLFGHSFIKLETADQQSDLWQTSLSYGAQVPDGENTLRYVYRGLTGGYTANYTDRYFYNQDLTYTRTEARDMWEYPLRLTPDALRLLQLHVWEVTNRHKRYYFLTHNCAYELGRLLEGALGRPAMRPARFWYLPEELVQQAVEAGLTGAPRYHPAAERRLIWHYHQLPDALRQRAERFMADGRQPLSQALAGLSVEKRRQLLDFLLTYQHFLAMQQMPNPDEQTRQLRHRLLLARLALPPSDAVPPEPPHRPDPLSGERATALWSGAHAQAGRLRGLIGGAPYARTAEGVNILEGDELTLLWTEVSFNRTDLRLERLDYIRILHHALSPLPKASPWSWRLLLRSERMESGRYDHQAHFGAGRSLRKGPLLFYALMTPALHSTTPMLRTRAETGVIATLGGATRLHVNAGVENGHDGGVGVARARLHHAFSPRFALEMEGRWRSDEPDSVFSLRLQWRF